MIGDWEDTTLRETRRSRKTDKHNRWRKYGMTHKDGNTGTEEGNKAQRLTHINTY